MKNNSGARPVGRWMASLDSGNMKTYWFSFSGMFLLMFLAMSLDSFVHGRSFIWFDDGLTQQYTAFIQQGEWLRSLFAALAHGSEIPMWDNGIGYGSDIILSLASSIGNPINLLSVFATPENADSILNATVPITLLLGGIAFSLFASYHRYSGFPILVGCMVYLFSGYSLLAFCQIYMLYPLVLAPLLILGVDKVFDGKSPALFIVALALLFASGIDNGYVGCLLLLVYCLVRYWNLPEKKSPKGFALWFLRIFGCIVLAAAMSAILLVPSAMSILSQNRIGLERPDELLYSLNYYLHTYLGFLGYEYIGSECFIGFAPIALIAVSALLFSKKSPAKTILVALFLIATICLLLPLFGKISNGFAYPNNRWVWGYSLLVGYMTTAALPLLKTLTAQQKKRIGIVVLVYAVTCLPLAVLRKDITLLAALVILIALISVLFLKGGDSPLWKKSVLASLLASCAITFYCFNIPGFGGAGLPHVGFGKAYDTAVTNSPNELVSDIAGTNWRYDTAGSASIWRNTSEATGKNGISFYNSFYNSAIDEYHTALGLSTSPFNFSYSSMDSRTVMEQFAGVRYLVAKTGEQAMYVPSLYGTLEKTQTIRDVEYGLYEADTMLPWAFLYKSAISQNSLSNLPPKQREYALLDSVAIDDGALPSANAPAEYSENIRYSAAHLASPEGAVAPFAEGESFKVGRKGTTLHIDATIPAGKQASLTISNLTYQETTGIDIYTDEEIKEMDAGGKIKLSLKTMLGEPSDGCTLTVSCGGSTRGVWQPGIESSLYGGKNTWVVDLGTSDQERHGVDIALPEPGWYSIGGLELQVENAERVNQALETLTSQSVGDLAFADNTLTCHVSADDSSWLFLRLPYSNGWHATVDGEHRGIERANIGFMALPLAEGDHEIELRYETPYLKEGAILSGIGILGFASLTVIRRRRAKRSSC